MNATTMEMYGMYLRLEKLGAEDALLEKQRDAIVDWNDGKPWDVIQKQCEVELRKQEASAG